MRQKSDKKKLLEGRCLGSGSDYVGFLKANEAKSIGTAGMIYDPIANRTVDVLSMGEKEFFYIKRFEDDVKTIQEQMLMAKPVVEKICEKYDFRVPQHVLSTDFLITYTDGNRIAYSVKSDRRVFDPESPENRKHPKRYERLLIRQFIEKEYWKMHGIGYQIVFRDELNQTLARNAAACLAFYDPIHAMDEEAMLKCLLVRKVIRMPMDQELICFAKVVKGQEKRIREIFERWWGNERTRS